MLISPFDKRPQWGRSRRVGCAADSDAALISESAHAARLRRCAGCSALPRGGEARREVRLWSVATYARIMRLILVRHGQTSSNVGLLLDTGEPGADLNLNGRAQADALVGRLAGQRIDAIYASTLVRTQQTAAPLAVARGLEMVIDPGLREISAGDAEMTSDASAYIDTLMRWHSGDLVARIPGGEDAAEFFARYDAAINGIGAAGHEAAVVVSHGAALRVWASARIPGFVDIIGNGHFANTGMITIDGSPQSGWTYIDSVGFMNYGDMDYGDGRNQVNL